MGLVRCVRRHAVQQRDDPTLGLREIHTCTQVLSHIKLATLRPHSAVHEQTTSLQPPPKGLPISKNETFWHYSDPWLIFRTSSREL